MPDAWTLRLSDAFDQRKGDMEIAVEVININDKPNRRILERSHALKSYSVFVAKVREQVKNGSTLEAAVGDAVSYCIVNDYLEEYFRQKQEQRSTSSNYASPSVRALGTFSHTTHDPISGAPSGLASWMGQQRSTSTNRAAPSACALGTFSQRLVVLKRIALTGLPYRMLKGKDYPLIPRILHCFEDGDETVVV